MLSSLAYTPLFGKPLMMWLGFATLILLFSAVAVVHLNKYAKAKLPVQWHFWLGNAGMVMAFVHAILVVAAYS